MIWNVGNWVKERSSAKKRSKIWQLPNANDVERPFTISKTLLKKVISKSIQV